jgi:hypothetical protein
MKKKFLAAAIGAMLVGGSAFAGLTDTVRVSSDGVGDLLVAPAYFIGGGMTTDLKVINTSMTDSVVAKVVFHHPVTSAEVLDFLIYLTPGDVWKATVDCKTVGADGNCAVSRVTSADGSMQYDVLTYVDPTTNGTLNGQTATDVPFASASAPAVIESGNAVDGRSPLPNQGYVTIVESRSAKVANGQGKFAPGVAKTAVKANYDAAVGVGPDETPNVLTGTVTANAGALGSATLPLLAVSNFDNSVKQVVATNTGLASYHTVGDLEDALWTNNYVVPYKVATDAISLVTFTFPTKLAYSNAVEGQYPFALSTSRDAIGAGVVGGADVTVSATAFDNEENTRIAMFNISPLPQSSTVRVPEFGWLLIGNDAKSTLNVGTYKEGWLNVVYTAPATAAATQSNGNAAVNASRLGAPGVVTVMNKQPGNFTWAYAASAR